MKSLAVIKVSDTSFKGILMCKASESSAISSPTITLDDGSKINMLDGSVIIEVDTNSRHLLYDGNWYKKQ